MRGLKYNQHKHFLLVLLIGSTTEKEQFNLSKPTKTVEMFYSNPTGYTVQFFSIEKFFALHVSDVTCIHRQEHNCSVQP
jgi:hypothetical protein